MIIVSGGAGFIGSNIIKALNERGISNILVVDDLTSGIKFNNIVDCQIHDYMDKKEFLARIQSSVSCHTHSESIGRTNGNKGSCDNVCSGHVFAEPVEAIFHQGACSDTTEWDGEFMMRNNYTCSKILLHYCLAKKIPFIYASSAAVYGGGQVFKEEVCYEKPMNMYGYSKFLFDQYVRRLLPVANSQIVGTRYFNVYGPREAHKGSMASVAFHNHQQMTMHTKHSGDGENSAKQQGAGVVTLFGAYGGYGAGEQRRDFVYVGDVAKVNLWFFDHPEVSGIFNVGSGRSQTFKEVSEAVINWHQRGRIEYIPFPEHLKGCYQSFTEADISALRAVGYADDFMTVEQGVKTYLDWKARQ